MQPAFLHPTTLSAPFGNTRHGRPLAGLLKVTSMPPTNAFKSPTTGWCRQCCDPPTSVMDDAGFDDESASIVIVGGGPHALAVLAALHELRDDNQLRAGAGSC